MHSDSELHLGDLILRGYSYNPADDTLDAGTGDLWIGSTNEGDMVLADSEMAPPSGLVVQHLRRRYEADGKVLLTLPGGDVRELLGVERILSSATSAA